MALQLNVESKFGMLIPNSYCCIRELSGTKELLMIQVHYYLNLDAKNSNLEPILVKGFSFVPSVENGSVNFIKQGYEYLKTLPEFEYAFDLL